MKKVMLIGAAALALTACSNQSKAEKGSVEPKVAENAVNAPQAAYDQSVRCFIYAGLNNMEQQASGEFTGNRIIPMLVEDATTKGAALGKNADTVKAELMAAVQSGAAETEAMSQPLKEAYVKKSVSEAITCLRDLRAQALRKMGRAQ